MQQSFLAATAFPQVRASGPKNIQDGQLVRTRWLFVLFSFRVASSQTSDPYGRGWANVASGYGLSV